MKKLMLIVLCIAVFAAVAVAQNPTYTQGTGIQGIDKLGAHQNGGRGCAGCHAPHSGARGNGGALQWNGTTFVSVAVTDSESGNDVLWGQDLGPLYNQSITTAGGADITFGTDFSNTPARIATGVMMCLSCHDGNLAKGAMMTNQSFEQTAGLLPAGVYGGQPIPTLLGNDGSSAGNYENDHPIGPKANLGSLGSWVTNYFTLTNGKISAVTGDGKYATFIANYGAFQTSGAPSYAGLAVDTGATDVTQAYVVCTTCHTPHSMYAFSGTAAGVKGVYPTYFFLLAPYNPKADVAGGTKASSATQFCRQCHFSGAGGANEASGINIPTAF